MAAGAGTGENGMTFGRAISEARKGNGWSLKEVASQIRREDGRTVPLQHLNDIGHGRRSPSSDRMVQGLARTPGVEQDWLYYLVGRFPKTCGGRGSPGRRWVRGMRAFRGARSRR